MRVSVDAVLSPLRAAGGQLVVADASALPPPDWAHEDGVVWLQLPGVPSYGLRQAAYARAEAPIIAVTEDHCAPAADWVAMLIAEHARYPDAAAIYGIVENGSRTRLVDWALYGVGYLAWAPPNPAADGNPGHANLSFKSWAFAQVVPESDEVLEFRYVAALRAAGHQVVASDRLRVTHYQSNSVLATGELLFHNGRAIAGLRRRRMAGRDWVRMFAPALIAMYRTARTLRLVRSKPALESVIVRSAPLIALLHLCHATGESVGYLGGPGNSGTRLH